MKSFFSNHIVKGNRRNESGMTLIELLVASVIGLILMTVAFQFFITQTKNFNESRQTAEMQQELRHATNFLNDHVKLAGNGVPSTIWQVLENHDGGSGYDSLCVLGSFRSLVVSTTQQHLPNGVSFKVTDNSEIGIGDLVFISSTNGVDQVLFMVTDKNEPGSSEGAQLKHAFADPWNTPHPFKIPGEYPVGSTVTVVSHYSFFVETDDEGRSNLMVQTQAYEPMILAGDIDDFQVRFKLKDDSWIDEPFALSDIRMVEITLRLKTPDPIQGYLNPVYGDAHKRVELKSIVIPKNIVIASR